MYKLLWSPYSLGELKVGEIATDLTTSNHKIRCFEVMFYEAFMKIQPKRHLFFFRFFLPPTWHLFPPNPQVAMLNSTAPSPWPQETNQRQPTNHPPTTDGRVGAEPARWKWIIGNSPGRRNRKRPVAKPWVWGAQDEKWTLVG